jgi:hypothetical protein
MPTNILSTVAIVVDFPYETPIQVQARDGDYSIKDPTVLVHELRLCEELLDIEAAECVHFDLTLGGTNLLDITDEFLFQLNLSPRGRSVLHAILPDLREIALSIDEKYHAPVLAMGKRSLPVRLAELHASAYGIARAMEITSTSETEEPISVGLPEKVLAFFDEEGKVKVTSDEPMERNLVAEAPISNGVLVEPFLNPMTRGFQVLRLTKTSEGDNRNARVSIPRD